MNTGKLALGAMLLAGWFSVFQPPLRAADHRDAPAVDGAGEGDISDIFAFLDPKDSGRLIMIMGVNPFSVPSIVQNYRFSKDFLYQFKIDRQGTYKEDFVVQIRFDNTPSTSQIAHVRVAVPDPGYVGTYNQ